MKEVFFQFVISPRDVRLSCRQMSPLDVDVEAASTTGKPKCLSADSVIDDICDMMSSAGAGDQISFTGETRVEIDWKYKLGKVERVSKR